MHSQHSGTWVMQMDHLLHAMPPHQLQSQGLRSQVDLGSLPDTRPHASCWYTEDAARLCPEAHLPKRMIHRPQAVIGLQQEQQLARHPPQQVADLLGELRCIALSTAALLRDMPSILCSTV